MVLNLDEYIEWLETQLVLRIGQGMNFEELSMSHLKKELFSSAFRQHISVHSEGKVVYYVKKRPSASSGLWAYAWRVVETYLAGDGEVQVTAGPIWDYNSDGLYDIPTNK